MSSSNTPTAAPLPQQDPSRLSTTSLQTSKQADTPAPPPWPHATGLAAGKDRVGEALIREKEQAEKDAALQVEIKREKSPDATSALARSKQGGGLTEQAGNSKLWANTDASPRLAQQRFASQVHHPIGSTPHRHSSTVTASKDPSIVQSESKPLLTAKSHDSPLPPTPPPESSRPDPPIPPPLLPLSPSLSINLSSAEPPPPITSSYPFLPLKPTDHSFAPIDPAFRLCDVSTRRRTNSLPDFIKKRSPSQELRSDARTPRQRLDFDHTRTEGSTRGPGVSFDEDTTDLEEGEIPNSDQVAYSGSASTGEIATDEAGGGQIGTTVLPSYPVYSLTLPDLDFDLDTCEAPVLSSATEMFRSREDHICQQLRVLQGSCDDERHTFSYQLLAQYAAELFSTNPDYAHITLRHFASYKAFCSSRNIRPFPILEITLALAIVNYGFPSPHLHSGAVRALAKVQARTSAPWLDIRLAAVDSRSGARSAINEVHKFIRAVPGWSPSNTTNKHRLANLEVKPCSLTARFENGEVRELSVPALPQDFRTSATGLQASLASTTSDSEITSAPIPLETTQSAPSLCEQVEEKASPLFVEAPLPVQTVDPSMENEIQVSRLDNFDSIESFANSSSRVGESSREVTHLTPQASFDVPSTCSTTSDQSDASAFSRPLETVSSTTLHPPNSSSPSEEGYTSSSDATERSASPEESTPIQTQSIPTQLAHETTIPSTNSIQPSFIPVQPSHPHSQSLSSSVMSTYPTLSSSVPSPRFTSSLTFYSARQLPPHLANARSHLLRLPSDASLSLPIPKQLLSFISSLSPPSASLDKVQLIASIMFRAGYDSFEAITELVAFESETREKVWEIVKLEMGAEKESCEVIEGIERRIFEGGQNGWIG